MEVAGEERAQLVHELADRFNADHGGPRSSATRAPTEDADIEVTPTPIKPKAKTQAPTKAKPAKRGTVAFRMRSTRK
jgi:hypothetical protein